MIHGNSTARFIIDKLKNFRSMDGKEIFEIIAPYIVELSKTENFNFLNEYIKPFEKVFELFKKSVQIQMYASTLTDSDETKRVFHHSIDVCNEAFKCFIKIYETNPQLVANAIWFTWETEEV